MPFTKEKLPSDIHLKISKKQWKKLKQFRVFLRNLELEYIKQDIMHHICLNHNEIKSVIFKLSCCSLSHPSKKRLKFKKIVTKKNTKSLKKKSDKFCF